MEEQYGSLIKCAYRAMKESPCRVAQDVLIPADMHVPASVGRIDLRTAEMLFQYRADAISVTTSCDEYALWIHEWSHFHGRGRL